MPLMPSSPLRIGIIGGTGLGDALASHDGQSLNLDTPFGEPSSPILTTQWHGLDIFIIQRHGPGHALNPTNVPYRANIFALKSLGVTHILASGATGSLRETIAPGQLVLADQVIDKTFRRPGTFYERAAVHIELAEPFCPVMRRWLRAAADRLKREGSDLHVHDAGTYVCMEGPAFSTRAESLMHQAWGGDLIGMTAMPEARLAREAEIAYALIAMPTDYDCWRPHRADTAPQALIAEIIANLQQAARNNLTLMKAALADVSLLRNEPSPAHDALQLAIWTDKSRIDPAEIDRLHPLWGRYFDPVTS